MSEREVYEFEKNATQKVKAGISNYKGKDMLYVRVYYEDKKTEDWLPSRNGLNLPIDMLPQLKIAVQKLEDESGVKEISMD